MSAAPANTPAIEFIGVEKRFPARGDSKEVLAARDVNFAIAPGEVVSIIGPSGCGKSTLLSNMGWLDEADSGSFFLNGTDAAGLGYSKRARLRNEEIGFIFQAFNLIPQMTVYENIELPLSYRKALTVKDRRERIRIPLGQVDLSGRDKDYPSQLSGGQQQRVAIARALAGSPILLLADEPTGNPDSQSGVAIMRLFDKLHKDGATVCIATHDQQHASVAQRRIALLDGKISSS